MSTEASKATGVSKALKAILSRCNTPDTFEEWCKEKKLLTPMDIALLSPNEASIAESIIKVCKAKVTSVEEPAVDVAIRKVWWFCREALTHPVADEKKSLDLEEMSDLETRWLACGGFTLSTRERVGKALLKKLHAMVSSDLVEFEIVLLEQITLMSTAPKTVDQLVKVTDGGIGLQAQQVQATTSAFDVLDKVKAYLFSFSYVLCANPDWCKFAQVRMAVEEISVKVQAAERH